MNSKRPVLFLKAHVKTYTRKDGTTVAAHDDNRPGAKHAAMAVAAAGQSRDKVYGDDTREHSEAAADESQRAKTPRDHMHAGLVHRDAALKHRTAAHYISRVNKDSPDIAHHRAANDAHQAAAAEHEHAASKPARDAADLRYAKYGPGGRPDPDAAAMQRYANGVRAEEARVLKSPEHKAMVAQSEAEVAKLREARRKK